MYRDEVVGLTTEELRAKCVVYCATFPNGKKYVGITRRKLWLRIREHYIDHIKVDLLFYRAIKKYGFKNIKWEILKYCKDNIDLQNSEIFYIDKLRTFKDFEDSNGYNLTLGGDYNIKLSESTLEKYRGSNNYNSNFKEDFVEKIKLRLYNGESVASLEREFNLKSRSLRAISTGKQWKHVLPELNDELKSRMKTQISVKDKANQIKTLIYEGKTNTEVCELLDVNVSMVIAIRNLRRYKNLLSEYNEEIFKTVVSKAKFSKEDVIFIKESCTNGLNYYDLSEHLNIKNDNKFKVRIRDIIYLKRFVDIGSEYNDELRRLYGKG